jgi:non-homologous end joining protein Ku
MRKLAALKSRGYEVAKGQYLWWRMMTKLDAIEIESTHVIEIDPILPWPELDQRFFDSPYYVTLDQPMERAA